jgi:hypothetical protein
LYTILRLSILHVAFHHELPLSIALYLYCLGITIGCLLALAKASIAEGGASVRIALPIDMKKLEEELAKDD